MGPAAARAPAEFLLLGAGGGKGDGVNLFVDADVAPTSAAMRFAFLGSLSASSCTTTILLLLFTVVVAVPKIPSLTSSSNLTQFSLFTFFDDDDDVVVAGEIFS